MKFLQQVWVLGHLLVVLSIAFHEHHAGLDLEFSDGSGKLVPATEIFELRRQPKCRFSSEFGVLIDVALFHFKFNINTITTGFWGFGGIKY